MCRLDLDVGTYALIPFTSGCHLKPREDDIEVGVVLLSQEGGGVALSDGCREALEEIFHRMDLDSNGFLGRTEFDFFQERTSGEICDDESWKVIQGVYVCVCVYDDLYGLANVSHIQTHKRDTLPANE